MFLDFNWVGGSASFFNPKMKVLNAISRYDNMGVISGNCKNALGACGKKKST